MVVATAVAALLVRVPVHAVALGGGISGEVDVLVQLEQLAGPS